MGIGDINSFQVEIGEGEEKKGGKKENKRHEGKNPCGQN